MRLGGGGVDRWLGERVGGVMPSHSRLIMSNWAPVGRDHKAEGTAQLASAILATHLEMDAYLPGADMHKGAPR